MQSLSIVLMCIAAAVGYGIVHDQVTARVCVLGGTEPRGWHDSLAGTRVIKIRK